MSESYWENSSGYKEMIFNSSGMVGNATKYSSEWCCPIKYTFRDNKCELNNTNGCTDLKTQAECVGAPSSLSYSQIQFFFNSTNACGGVSTSWFDSSNSLCANGTSCSCVWSSGKCSANRTIQTSCDNGFIYTKSCVWTESGSENMCDSLGKIIVRYIASGDAINVESWCVDQSKEYPCSVSVKLPFFDGTSLMLSILGIVFVYAFIRRGK
jgi:hypothetical protein